jgi:integrase
MAAETSKTFAGFRLRQGVARAGVTFHSLRKTIAQALDGIVPRGVLAALLGHARGFSLDTYSPTGPNFQILVDAIGKLSFPGLRL